jgi:glycogen operon protein
MDWFTPEGTTMTIDDWHSPEQRTLQYLAASTPEFEAFNRILLVVHAHESEVPVVLPEHVDVTGYELLWDSAHDHPAEVHAIQRKPGQLITMSPQSMRLFRAHGEE